MRPFGWLGLCRMVVLPLAALPGAARAADLVVLESRGIDLKPGQVIDGAKPLTLTDGQQVTLIAPTGKIIKLRGPLTAPAVSGGTGDTIDVTKALKSLITEPTGRAGELTVVRGTIDEIVPPDPWLIDVTHDGNRCLPEQAPIIFWRPGGGGETSLTIAPYDRSWKALAEWPSGQDRITVPGAVPIRQRTTYIVTVGGKESALTLITVPSTLANDAMRTAWMMEEDCQTQAIALVRSAR